MFLLKFTLTVPGEEKAAAFSNQSSQRLLETNNVNKVLCSLVGPPSYNHNCCFVSGQDRLAAASPLQLDWTILEVLGLLCFFLLMPTTEKQYGLVRSIAASGV